MARNSRLKVLFRVWDSENEEYVWIDTYSDRIVRVPGVTIEMDSSLLRPMAFSPTLTSIEVYNGDGFWSDLERRAPELADGADPYRAGFKGRQVRIIEVEGSQERVWFTGAVRDIKYNPGEPTATIELVGMARLAQEQKCDGETIDDAVAYGDWWDTEKPNALYESRMSTPNGGVERRWYRHKRINHILKRTLMPRTDDVASAEIENVVIKTQDGRRTITALSFPGIPYCMAWGDPDQNICYIAGTDASGQNCLLWVFDYASGNIIKTITLAEGGMPISPPFNFAWCGMFYNPHALGEPRVYVSINYYMFEYSTVSDELTYQPLPTTDGTSDVLFFVARRGQDEQTRGTVWITHNYWAGNQLISRLEEWSCWDLATWQKLLDSGTKYKWNCPYEPEGWDYFRASACCQWETADPNGEFQEISASIDIYIWVYCPHFTVPGFREMGRCRWNGSSWLDWVAIIPYQSDAIAMAPGDIIQVPNSDSQYPNGVVFTKLHWDGPPGHVRQRTGLFGAYERYPGQWYTTLLEPDYISSRKVCLKYGDPPRLFYLTAYEGQDGIMPWNARLRSINANNIEEESAQDENRNPADAPTGDPPTEFAWCAQQGGSIITRYKTGEWELHGIMLEEGGTAILFHYTSEFYPVLPLVDVSGLNLWELRVLLAEVCNCTAFYDGNGAFKVKRLPGSYSGQDKWPGGKTQVLDSGWNNVISGIATQPYYVRKAASDINYDIIQQCRGSGSTGSLLAINVSDKVGEIRQYQLRFTSTTGYDLFQLNEQNNWEGIAYDLSIDTQWNGDGVSLGPGCFAGQFAAGDVITVVVLAPALSLEAGDWRSEIRVENIETANRWGKQEMGFNNRFYPKVLITDYLTQRLEFLSRPHIIYARQVSSEVGFSILETRKLEIGEAVPGFPSRVVNCMLIGFERKFGAEPEMTIKLMEG